MDDWSAILSMLSDESVDPFCVCIKDGHGEFGHIISDQGNKLELSLLNIFFKQYIFLKHYHVNIEAALDKDFEVIKKLYDWADIHKHIYQGNADQIAAYFKAKPEELDRKDSLGMTPWELVYILATFHYPINSDRYDIYAGILTDIIKTKKASAKEFTPQLNEQLTSLISREDNVAKFKQILGEVHPKKHEIHLMKLLVLAYTYNQIKVFEYLAHLLDPSLAQEIPAPDNNHTNGESILYEAAAHGRTEIVKILITLLPKIKFDMLLIKP